MSLTVGARLGPYEIVAPLGAGGMGEVYRARDTRLGRDVAIKILPEFFASDADRVARFEREARALAAINHPNIAAIYGLEEIPAPGQPPAKALILELVEGPTLQERLRDHGSGGLPVPQALAIARQIAEALEAAHEQGIVHRDLKPANIKIAADDKVKVLDFGLAKFADPAGASSPSGSGPRAADLTHSPTLSMMATQAGVILGTAAYMSPEQAKGSPADHRSDVFSFGTVLYEMLTGRQPFSGDTAPEILASVLIREPNLGVLPADLHPRLVDLLRRCLDKNPKRRWQAVGDLRVEIEAIAAISTVAAAPTSSTTREVARLSTPSWKRAMPAAVAAAAASIATGLVVWTLRPQPASDPVRFAFDLVYNALPQRPLLDISRDGRRILFELRGQLYLRSLSDLEATLVSGTEGLVARSPVFSPDGQSIAFHSFADNTLRRTSVTGGAPITICQIGGNFEGLSWGADGIVFARGESSGGLGGGGAFRVSPDGGEPEQIVSATSAETVYGPQLLPGAEAVLFTVADGDGVDRWDRAKVVAQRLGSGDRTVLVNGGSDARYLSTGHLVYASGGRLFAVRFDPARLEVRGAPTPVLEGVRRGDGGTGGAAHFGVSDNGTLVYLPGPVSVAASAGRLAFVDRQGKVDPLPLPVGQYMHPRFSPDGTRIAVERTDREAAIWIHELSDATSFRRLTFEGNSRYPIWSGDGRHVAFQSNREGDAGIFWQLADGSGAAERLTRPEQGTAHVPEAWMAKTERFAFSQLAGTSVSLQMYSVPDRKAEPVPEVTSPTLIQAVFSADGRWLAYTDRLSGTLRIVVQPFPMTGAKYQASEGNGGHHALWAPDGTQLFYFPASSPLASVGVRTRPSFSVGRPDTVPGSLLPTTTPGSLRHHDIAPDGSRFVFVTYDNETDGRSPTEVRVVLNWFEELQARVP